MAARIYVYGIVHADAAIDIVARPVGIEAGPVETRRIGALGLVMSPIADAEILPIRRNTISHTKVLEELLLNQVTVLPMQFGVVLDSFEIAAKAIAPREAHLLALLAELDGRIEVGITVRFKRDGLFEEIASERPEIGRRGRELVSADEVQSYHQRVAIGQQVEKIIRQKNASDHNEILHAIAPLCVKHKELPVTDDMIVVRLACLVAAEAEPQLFDLVASFQKARDARCDVSYLAPVPPYNFVRASLNWDDAGNAGG
ncbi:putative gas vesicle synthesis protein, GvpF/L-like [Bradyrhizobium sp. ORS 278]|uniref:GvpL/GvpF family gas vesicle protein n=1 Tax=Bradyrhizobium sp. (strain ORS 278) TaxID=114615 RepID=UPI0001507D26|nr:GvpL/GvpF family gas vesicle protein [Bradyrhizobium sp. ORS 278]CAL75174.1 putative gas vesicle synthesis protein, GvpF/L-like [Bradyrhizobium sp. ORS 278]